MNQLINKYNLHQGHISSVCRRLSFHHNGWLLYENKSKKSSYNNYEIFHFYHDIYGEEKCTQNELTTKHSLTRSAISNICSEKILHHKGW